CGDGWLSTSKVQRRAARGRRLGGSLLRTSGGRRGPSAAWGGAARGSPGTRGAGRGAQPLLYAGAGWACSVAKAMGEIGGEVGRQPVAAVNLSPRLRRFDPGGKQTTCQ